MRIRKYQEEDKEKVKQLILEVLTELFGKNLIKEWEDFSDYKIFYVAEDKGKAIGTIALKDIGNKTGKLKRMYVLKDYRKKGIGQKLFNKILDFAEKNNFYRILLSTSRNLIPAYNFYVKNGFRELKNIDWEKDFAELKREDVNINDVVFMEKNLK